MNEEKFQQNSEKMRKYEDVFWGIGDDEDLIDKKLVAAVSSIEAICYKELISEPWLLDCLKGKIHNTALPRLRQRVRLHF